MRAYGATKSPANDFVIVAVGRRAGGMGIALLFAVCAIGTCLAQAAQVSSDDLDSLFKTLNSSQSSEPLRKWQTDEGFLRFVGAPPGTYFAVPQSAKSASAESVAQTFLTQHPGIFTTSSHRQTFATERVNSQFSGRSYVRLLQVYQSIPVFGARMVVQTHGADGVSCVMSDLMRDLSSFDSGASTLTPSVSDSAAQDTATQFMLNEYKGVESDYALETPQRVIFDPAIFDHQGAPVIAWRLAISSTVSPAASEMVIVSGITGEVIFHYPLAHDAKVRAIYDADNTYSFGELVRSEGDPLCNIKDADLAYDYLGDTYDFYYNEHNRDSIDNAGMRLVSTVRMCYYGCPMDNAFWVGGSYNRMFFGDGYVVDDVAAHELTHGVTDSESQLIYLGQSGAINESLSDIWGEFVDLTNGKGNDTAAVRWLCGEDLPDGAIRSMKDPTKFGDPDRVNSPLYESTSYDNYGVHENSGIINKLCYLLTDGDTFNGQTVTGFGIDRVAKLFYELQTALLYPGSDFNDLYLALGQATINQDFTFDERLNVRSAGQAVEIAPATGSEEIQGFRAIPTTDNYGRPVIALTWTNPSSSYFRRVILVRSTTEYVANPSEGTRLYQGAEEKYLDIAVTKGTKYYYTLFTETDYGFPDRATTSATAGAATPDFLTQAFETYPASASTTPSPIDLSYSQLTFWPIGAPTGGLGEPSDSDYANYAATIKHNVYTLPVARQDDEGVGQTISYNADMVYYWTFSAPFPFFGADYYSLYVGANGFIAFDPVYSGTTENSEISLASHFSVPRVSFLFSHFMPTAGGTIWARGLWDRFVVTFEDVLEVDMLGETGSGVPSTVQVEVFHSGQIRVTYLSLGVENAIVGLSDGNGAPVDPGTVFDNVHSVNVRSDLSEEPHSLSTIALEPVDVQYVEPGELMSFDVQVHLPVGVTGVPSIQAEWDGDGVAPFADNGDGTGSFRWQTDALDMNQILTVRLTATLGSMATYQDVTLLIGVEAPLPEALNLCLSSGDPVEDPSISRPVSMEMPLYAQYTYSHPLAVTDPTNYAEGASRIMWFRNDIFVASFNNQKVVPPVAFKAEDRWFFVVTPVTESGLEGMPRMSPVVTVLPLPYIENVALASDVPEDVSVSELPLSGLPAPIGSSAGGASVVILGKHLADPLTVTVGGVAAKSIHAVSDNRIEIVTAEHATSAEVGGVRIPEDVKVTTRYGAGTAREAFTYVPADVAISKADVNLDGVVNAVDIQLVINAVLQKAGVNIDADVNRDGSTNASDIQVVINVALAS